MMKKILIAALSIILIFSIISKGDGDFILFADLEIEPVKIIAAGQSGYFILESDRRSISHFDKDFQFIKRVSFPISGPYALEMIDALLWQPPGTLYVVDGLSAAVFELDRYLSILKRYKLPDSELQFRQFLSLSNRSWLLVDPFSGALMESIPGANQLFEWGNQSLKQLISDETLFLQAFPNVLVWIPKQKKLFILSYRGKLLHKWSFKKESAQGSPFFDGQYLCFTSDSITNCYDLERGQFVKCINLGNLIHKVEFQGGRLYFQKSGKLWFQPDEEH
jgi:hypothetical protein